MKGGFFFTYMISYLFNFVGSVVVTVSMKITSVETSAVTVVAVTVVAVTVVAVTVAEEAYDTDLLVLNRVLWKCSIS